MNELGEAVDLVTLLAAAPEMLGRVDMFSSVPTSVLDFAELIGGVAMSVGVRSFDFDFPEVASKVNGIEKGVDLELPLAAAPEKLN